MRIGVDDTVSFGRLDHGDTDAILDAVQRLKKFTLSEHGGMVFGNQAIDLDHGRVADRRGRVAIYFSAWHV